MNPAQYRYHSPFQIFQADKNLNEHLFNGQYYLHIKDKEKMIFLQATIIIIVKLTFFSVDRNKMRTGARSYYHNNEAKGRVMTRNYYCYAVSFLLHKDYSATEILCAHRHFNSGPSIICMFNRAQAMFNNKIK